MLTSKLAVAVAVILLVASTADAAKKKKCEVCEKMVGKFIQACKDKKVKLDDREGVQGLMREICEKTKNTRENRFCYYIGGTKDAATGLLNEVSGPMSRFLPPSAVCSKLKKMDGQICELEYEEVIDLKTIDLNKQKVKTLKKILNEQFDDGCKGCLEKSDFVKRVETLMKERDEL